VSRQSPRLSLGPKPPKEIKSELLKDDWDMVQALADGWTTKQIADNLRLSYGYIKTRMHSIYDLAGVYNAASLVAYGFRQGKIK